MPVGEKKVGLPELFYDFGVCICLIPHHRAGAPRRRSRLRHVSDFAGDSVYRLVIPEHLHQPLRRQLLGGIGCFCLPICFCCCFCPMRWAATGWRILCRFNLALGLLVGNVCLQYLLQLARHASPEQRRRIKLVAGLRGLTAATVLGSLLFPANIGQWVALGGFGLGWILPAFVRHKHLR